MTYIPKLENLAELYVQHYSKRVNEADQIKDGDLVALCTGPRARFVLIEESEFENWFDNPIGGVDNLVFNYTISAQFNFRTKKSKPRERIVTNYEYFRNAEESLQGEIEFENKGDDLFYVGLGGNESIYTVQHFLRKYILDEVEKVEEGKAKERKGLGLRIRKFFLRQDQHPDTFLL